jgi:hypothetical protein
MSQIIQIGREPIYTFPDGRIVELPIHKAFIESKAKRKIFIAHRRGRKTSICLEEMFKYLISNPKIIGKTLAPIRKQAKEIIWDDPDMLFSIIPPEVIYNKNTTELKITLKNGSIWYLDGADQPDFQRGGNVKVLHLTEAGDHRPEVWTNIYEPVLTLNGGVGLFEGNPRGENWYKNLFVQARDRVGWETFLVSAYDTPIFTKEQLEDIKQSVPENVFKAEYLCEWVGSQGAVFKNYHELAVLEEKEAERGRKYRAGIDLAKLQDYTVVSVIDRHNWEQVKMDRVNKLDWGLIKEQIQRDLMAYSSRENDNAVEAVIESNGIGDPIFDDLVKWSFTVGKTHNIVLKPFRTSNASKNLLVSNMSMLFDQKYVKILKNEILLDEIGSFTYQKTRDNYVYGAPSGMHDDTVMSLMIAYWNLGTKRQRPNYDDEQIKTLEQRFKEKLQVKKQKNINDLYSNYVI